MKDLNKKNSKNNSYTQLAEVIGWRLFIFGVCEIIGLIAMCFTDIFKIIPYTIGTLGYTLIIILIDLKKTNNYR